MNRHPALPWLAALLAGGCFGLGLGTRLGAPLALIGSAAWFAAHRGERWDAVRGLLIGGLCAAGWFRELPDLWNTYGTGWGWPIYAALVGVQALPYGLLSLVVGRAHKDHRGAVYTLALGTLPLVMRFMPVPLDLATLAAFTPALLWPVALAGTVGFGLALGTVGALTTVRPRLAGATLATWLVAGMVWHALPQATPTIDVSLVQPDIGVFDARRASTVNLRAQRIQRLLSEATGLALLPETAWPRRGLPEVDGSVVLGHVGPGPSNRLTALSSGDVFDKRELLPIAETPFLGLGNVHFDAGQGLRRISTPTVDLAPLICFEDLVPRALAEAAWDGGGPLLLATNDSWLGLAGNKHLAASVLAAIRTRRWAARPATTGPSAIIDPRGRIRASTPAQHVPTGGGRVLHGRIGTDAPVWVPVLVEPWLALLCGLGLWLRMRRP